MDKLSFVIPCYNSEKTIQYVVDSIRKELKNKSFINYEIILVNDFSKDNTSTIIENLAKNDKKIIAINFSKNFGQHAALMAGFRNCTGDVVIYLDDDGQCPVNKVFELIEPLDNDFDISIADYGKKKQSKFKNFGSKVNDIMAEHLINKPKDLKLSNFGAMKRFVVDEIVKYQHCYPYIAGLILRTSSKIANVKMEENERKCGKSNYSFKKLLSLWLNGFTSFSVKPLRLTSVAGVIFAFLGFIFGLYTIINKLFINKDVAIGYSTIVSFLTFFSGIILMVLGMIGEYIGRIFISLNKSPQYVIRNSVNLNKHSEVKIDYKKKQK